MGDSSSVKQAGSMECCLLIHRVNLFPFNHEPNGPWLKGGSLLKP
jgi:hypothetical protein